MNQNSFDGSPSQLSGECSSHTPPSNRPNGSTTGVSQVGIGWPAARNPYTECYPVSQFIGESQGGPGTGVSQVGECVSQSWPSLSARGAVPSRPLRMIHVGQCLLRAGIEYWLKGLIRNLDRNKIQFVRCVVASDQYDASVAVEMGVPVEVGGAESVRRAARECDVLLISGPPECGAWLADTPPKLALFVAHGDGYWTRNVLLGCAPIIDHVVAVSQRVAQMTCHGFATTAILNGVDATHVACRRSREQVRQSLGFQPGDFVLGFVGRFSSEKSPEILIHAVAQLPSRFKALLVGWGPMRPSLMDEANERIPGRYAFATARGNVGDFFAAMDAFCLTSSYEGYGLVMMEAMMCERPVITRPVGFAPECIRDRITGVIVDGSPASFARAARLLGEHDDWAKAVAREGRRLADQIGHASRMCREYEELIARLYNAKHESC